MRFLKIIFIISLVIITLGGCEQNNSQPQEVSVPILMFHDIKSFEGGEWSISCENFRKKHGVFTRKRIYSDFI